MNGVNDSCVNQTLVVLPGWEYTTKGIRSESQDALMSRKIFSHCPFFIHPRGLHVLKTIDRKVLSLRLSVLLPAVAGVCGKNCNSVHSLPAWMTCQASNDCPISSELVSVTLKMESGGQLFSGEINMIGEKQWPWKP